MIRELSYCLGCKKKVLCEYGTVVYSIKTKKGTKYCMKGSCEKHHRVSKLVKQNDPKF